MGDVIYQGMHYALVEGLLAGSPDIRLMLVMSGFTGETEEDAINLADISTLDEFDGIGYLQIDCANVDFSYDAADDEYQLTFDPAEFNAGAGSVAAGSDDAMGMVVYLYVDGTDANDIILGYTDAGGFPLNGTGTAITYTPHADGLLYTAAA